VGTVSLRGHSLQAQDIDPVTSWPKRDCPPRCDGERSGPGIDPGNSHRFRGGGSTNNPDHPAEGGDVAIPDNGQTSGNSRNDVRIGHLNDESLSAAKKGKYDQPKVRD
jgi:hypothetical protein